MLVSLQEAPILAKLEVQRKEQVDWHEDSILWQYMISQTNALVYNSTHARTSHVPGCSGCFLTAWFETGLSTSLLLRAVPLRLSRLTGLTVRLIKVWRDSVVRRVSVVVEVFLVLWKEFLDSARVCVSSGMAALVGRLRC